MSVVNLKCLLRCDHDAADRTGHCCAGTDRHSQPNAYMETNLNGNRTEDASKEKDVTCSTQPEYCYIDIGDMDGERRPSSSVYEEIDYCQRCPSIRDDSRCHHRDTLFDNDSVLEIMENDIYGSSEDENEIFENDVYDRSENVEVIENDIYDRSEDESVHSVEIIENDIYDRSEDESVHSVEIIENDIYDRSEDESVHSVEIIENDIYDKSEDESEHCVEIIDNDMYDSLSNMDIVTAAAGGVENHVYEEVDLEAKGELRMVKS